MDSRLNKYQIDMCHGPLAGKIFRFAMPLIASSILQLLFHASDLIVVGRFASHASLAAVGVCGPLINLLICISVGISVGTNVLTANYIGAGDKENLKKTVHTSITFAFIAGFFVSILTLLSVKPMLRLMGTPDDIFDKALLYMQIFSSRCPTILLYNFGSAILRSDGDTQHPLYYLGFSGVMNALLNLLFVIVFRWDVAGVGIATCFSSWTTGFLIMRLLIKTKADYRFEWRKMAIDMPILKKILLIGLPAGVQSACFSLSNLIIQAAVNSLGSVVVAGNTAAVTIEHFVYAGGSAFHIAITSFAGQNYGAKNFHRIKKSLNYCLLFSALVNIAVGSLCLIFARSMLNIFNSDAGVIAAGLLRMQMLCPTYWICAIMDVFTGAMRGIGHAILPGVISLVGACIFRVFWVWWIFPFDRTLSNLTASYPISWILTTIVSSIVFFQLLKKQQKSETAAL